MPDVRKCISTHVTIVFNHLFPKWFVHKLEPRRLVLSKAELRCYMKEQWARLWVAVRSAVLAVSESVGLTWVKLVVMVG